MISLTKWRASSYINCLKDYFNDNKLVSSMAFLIAASKGDSLYVFAPDTDCIIYTEELITDVKGRCEEYVKLFSSYKQDIIKSASLKLWHYYANKKVEFTDEEKKLLSQLGIRL